MQTYGTHDSSTYIDFMKTSHQVIIDLLASKKIKKKLQRSMVYHFQIFIDAEKNGGNYILPTSSYYKN